MVNIDQYKEMAERMKDLDENTNDSHPGDGPPGVPGGPPGGIDGRATMVPTPGGFPTLQVCICCKYYLCDPFD